MFRQKQQPVTAAREKICQAIKEGRELTLREAVAVHYTYTHPPDDTLILLPPDATPESFSAIRIQPSTLTTSKVSQIRTRQTERNKK
jgi:hypothetical protein